MLDCPVQSQTSPTTTSRSVTVAVSMPAVARTSSSRPLALASCFGKVTANEPSLAALVVCRLEPNATLTSAPALAVPQIVSFSARCRTM